MSTAPVARYLYRDADGVPMFTVLRYVPKRFHVVDADDRAIAAIPEPGILYRLPELRAAKRVATVFVCEGEKDVETLRQHGLVAVTNPGGCHMGWRAHYSPELRGRHVVILADNDGPGHRHAQTVKRALGGIAASAIVLRLPRLGGAEDVTDWLKRRGGSIPWLLEEVAKVRCILGGLKRGAGSNELARLILAASLEPLEKLVLLSILHETGGKGVNDTRTAGQIADAIPLHRVTVQRILGRLEGLAVISRDGGGRSIQWQILALLRRAASPTAEAA